MKSGIIMVVVLLVIIGVCQWFIWTDYANNKDVVVSRTYAGRLYMEEEEYSQFKQYLANHPDVAIIKMDVLSSPDALVDMELKAPPEAIVPYGDMVEEKMEATLEDSVLNAGMVVVVPILVALFIFKIS